MELLFLYVCISLYAINVLLSSQGRAIVYLLKVVVNGLKMKKNQNNYKWAIVF